MAGAATGLFDAKGVSAGIDKRVSSRLSIAGKGRNMAEIGRATKSLLIKVGDRELDAHLAI